MLRYPGGKTRAVKTLATHLPNNVETVISPFLGGGSFELYLTGQDIQVYASDMFQQLVHFWQTMHTHPDQLAAALQKLLCRVDKATFLQLQTDLRQNMMTPLETATAFYAVNRCSFSGTTLSGGYSQNAAGTRFTQSSIDRVRNYHNDLLHVAHKPYEEALQQDADLLFLDPPYLLGGSRDALYGDRGTLHEAFDHVHFRNVVKSHGSKALITYNNTPAIHELWADRDWTVTETSWSYGMNASKQSSEVIIKNY